VTFPLKTADAVVTELTTPVVTVGDPEPEAFVFAPLMPGTITKWLPLQRVSPVLLYLREADLAYNAYGTLKSCVDPTSWKFVPPEGSVSVRMKYGP
jgi:hypothetical protein